MMTLDKEMAELLLEVLEGIDDSDIDLVIEQYVPYPEKVRYRVMLHNVSDVIRAAKEGA